MNHTLSEFSTTTPADMPPGVVVSQLACGLTLIMREDHSAPVVSAQAWCKAGSIHEGRWLGAGLSHVLEHMLFKGTTTRAPGKIDQEVQDAGGHMNAYTSFDRTVYYIDVPSTGTQCALDILCDITQNATLPEAELVKELDVIRREMAMGQDDPGQRSGRRLFETAYTQSPCRFPIIGYADVFNEIKREDVLAYYRERYVPNNLFFVVVGDISPAEVEARINAGFAGAKMRPLAPMVLPVEPRQMARREVREEAAIELGHLHISWHIPDVRHPDVPVLDVLATILGSGRSSRLYQQVREAQGVVHSVDAWTYSPGNPGLLGSSAMVDGQKCEAASQAILAEVERLKCELTTPAEIAKAVRQFTTGTLSARKTMAGQAQDLGGSWLSTGDLNFSARYLAAVRQVTPEQVQRVARTYLTPENQTLYALLPQGSLRPSVSAAELTTALAARMTVLPNGLRLIIKSDRRLPFVEFRAVFRGGVLAETPANNGITLLMSRMLMKGTLTRTAEGIASTIESLGGGIDSYSANNSFGVSMEVLNEDFSTGFDLLADVLRNPAFPAPELEREREVQLAGIRAQKDHLLQNCGRMMRNKLFGPAGYGLDISGTEESVRALTQADLRQAHAELAVPTNCVLSICGDVDPAEVEQAVASRLGVWPGTLKLPAPAVGLMPPGVLRVSEKLPKEQGVMVCGFLGTTLFEPDRYALELIQESCSDMGSRLFTRIRDEMGLAYYVGAQHMMGLVPGYFAFYVGTEPDKVAVCEAELMREVELLRESGLSDVELKRAKAKIVGQRKISRQDIGNQAMSMALDELYGLGFTRSDQEDAAFEAVTPEQIIAAARKYLTPERRVVSVVHP
jgi:zinc protease